MERWIPVVGHESAYEVSDLGRVRSLDRVERYERKDQYSGRTLTVARQHRGRVLSPGRMSGGHLSVSLAGRSCLVHVLVLTAFVGTCPDGCESLHGNGNPSDNRVANLRWGTRTENLIDAVKHGAKPIGERVWSAKLARDDIQGIRKACLSGRGSVAALARRFSVSETTIRQVRDGRTWKHVEVSA